MKKFNKITKATLIILCLSFVYLSLISGVNAMTFPQSSKIALVPDSNGLNSNGGALPTNPSGGWPGGETFTFVDVHPDSIRDDTVDPIADGGFDTVVIVMIDYFHTYYWSNTQFRNRIETFVYNGGKLILYDSEVTVNDWSTFTYPFTASTPGAYGASGPCWIVENNTLSHNDTASSSYVNTALLTGTDAAGDANAMVTQNSNWYVDMVAQNTFGVTGPVHTYAIYGDGLIIYNGLDIDYLSSTSVIGNGSGQQVLGMIWYLELLGQSLPGTNAISVSGLTLTPKTATNYIGSMHTVTAKVTNAIAAPIPGVTVDFKITDGPNAGLTGSGVTDAQGEATFSWVSVTVGIDEVTANITSVTGQPVEATATKEWIRIPDNVIPEVPFGTIAIAAAMLVAFGLFYIKRTPRKT